MKNKNCMSRVKIEKMVDDLIHAAIEYTDSLFFDVPLTVFDLKAERLCAERDRLICFLMNKK